MRKKWTVKYDCRGMETDEIIDKILVQVSSFNFKYIYSHFLPE